MKHTQGAWYFEYENSGNGSFLEWYELQTEDDLIGKIYKTEDAEFIVRACNAHDDLLEACKFAISSVEVIIKGAIEIRPSFGETFPSLTGDGSLHDMLTKAIEKATKENA